jgi:NAD(P)-dependent dehydrogenase (short-subunit alcohol dehydrogenase family)
LHALDVRCAEHIANLAAAVASEGIDVLIHNAGVSGRGMWRETVMAINAAAPIAVVKALLGAVQRGSEKKIVLMTSQLGARYGSTRILGVYGDSKAALNDTFRQLAPAWGQAGLIAIVMHPGWVRTDMGGRSAPLAVADSVAGIRRLIARLTPAEHGRFWTWDGREHAW